MPDRTARRALWWLPESSFETTPDSDGSDFLAVPAGVSRLGDLQDARELLETAYQDGYDQPTTPLIGADGGSFDFEVPLFGLATAAGDGATVPANDWLDHLLDHIFSASAAVVGEGVGASSTTTTLVLDTDPTGYDAQQLIPVYEAAIPTARDDRTQWTLLTASTGPSFAGCRPAFQIAPTTAAVAYGTKTWRAENAFSGGGSTLACAYQQDSIIYELLGCRVTRAVLAAQRGGIWTLKGTMGFTAKRDATAGMTSLPAHQRITRPALVNLLSPFWFNGVRYPVQSIEIDLGITASPLDATEGANGRAGFDVISIKPTVKVNPAFSQALQDLKRAASGSTGAPLTGPLMVQLGAGRLASGVLNAMAFHAEAAYAMAANPADDGGRQRIGLEFQIANPGIFTGTTRGRFAQLVRA